MKNNIVPLTPEINALNRDNQDLSEKIAIFFTKLEKIDLQPVAKRLISVDTGWTASQAELAINRYKIFLCLHFLFPDLELVPTKEIDEVWHTHILLNTYKYMLDCQELYGYILHHHSPIEETSPIESQHNETAFAVTKNLLEKLFGLDTLGNIGFQPAPCFLSVNPLLQKSLCLILPSSRFQVI